MKIKDIKETFFITHVHWDREWYWPVEKYRFRLFEVFEAIKKTIERDDYHSFWLDGQTVFLEDYLLARPQDRELIKSWVEKGKLHVGPFYVLNDEQLPCGEAQVRNFIIGMKIASEFGPIAKVGYMPDNFGHMSQTPQLLNGFGIDNAVMGRGFIINDDTEDLAIWKGADGSEVLAVLLSRHYSACAGLDLNDDKSFERALASIEFIQQHCSSGKFLIMYGTDHSLPNPDTARLIRELVDRSSLESLKHSSFDEFLDSARLTEPTYRLDGELMYVPHLDGTYSANIWQKALNRRAEKELTLYSEPLASIAEIMTGKEYAVQDFERAWKYLLRAHPHDSIPGCHADRVADDMRTRLLRSHDISSTIAEKSFDAIQKLRLDYEDPADCKVLNVFNPLPHSRSEVIKVEIYLPDNSGVINNISLKSCNGILYKAVVLSNKSHCCPKYSDYMIPIRIPHQRVLIEFGPVELMPMGFTSFEIICGKTVEAGNVLLGTAVEGDSKNITTMVSIQTSPGVLENEYLKVTINHDATVDILNKDTQHSFENIHHIEAEQDAGSLYHSVPLIGARKYYIKVGATTLIRNSSVSATYMLEAAIDMPVGIGLDNVPSEKIVSTSIKLFYTLTAGEKYLRIRTEIDNRVNNAIIRACFQTGMNDAENLVHTPFDIVKRPPLSNDLTDLDRSVVTRYAASEFTSVSDGEKGLAILNNGLPEYCFYQNGQIDITLLRGSRFIWGRDAKQFPVVEYKSDNGQCLGMNVAEYALFPFVNSIDDGTNLRTAFEYGAAPRCRLGKTGLDLKGLEISNPMVRMTALKKSENGNGYILRFVNLSTQSEATDITLPWSPKQVERVKLDETEPQLIPLADSTVSIEVSPKEIVTLKLHF